MSMIPAGKSPLFLPLQGSAFATKFCIFVKDSQTFCTPVPGFGEPMGTIFRKGENFSPYFVSKTAGFNWQHNSSHPAEKTDYAPVYAWLWKGKIPRFSEK